MREQINQNPRLHGIEVKAEMPIWHNVKLSALLESRQHAKCFILHIPRARPCLNCFKELTKECLVKAYPFESITWPTSSSNYKVR